MHIGKTETEIFKWQILHTGFLGLKVNLLALITKAEPKRISLGLADGSWFV